MKVNIDRQMERCVENLRKVNSMSQPIFNDGNFRSAFMSAAALWLLSSAAEMNSSRQPVVSEALAECCVRVPAIAKTGGESATYNPIVRLIAA